MSGIRKKFLFQLLYAFSQAAFPLITYPYITRKLGAEGIGLVGYVEYVSGFIITIASFGIPFYGVREIAKVQDDEQKKQAILRRLFSFHFLVSLFGCAVFVGLMKANQQQNISSSLLLLGCINILLPAFIAEWYMQGIEAFAFTTIRSIVLRFAGLIALLLFVNGRQDYIIYYLIIILVQVAVAVTNMRKIGWKGFQPKLHKEGLPLKSLWHFFLTTSIISVYVFFDVLILGWVADEVHVGYYTVAIRIVKLSLLLVLSLNVILFPRISYLKFTSADETKLHDLIQKAMQFIIVVTLPLGAGFYFMAPQIIDILAGNQFTPSVLLVQILSVLPLFIGFSNLFVFQILTPFGREKQLLLCVAVTCTLSLLLHLTLSRLWIEKGTAVATIATEMFMTLLTATFAFKTFRFRFPYYTLLQSCIASFPFILVIVVCRNYVASSFAVIVISATTGLMMYVFLQLSVFKNALLTQIWSDVKQLKWSGANE